MKPLAPLAVFGVFVLTQLVSWFALLMKQDFRDLRAFEATMAETTASGYIQHHLQNLTFGQLPYGGWGFATPQQKPKKWALGFPRRYPRLVGRLGLIFILIFRMAAKRRLPVNQVPCRTSLKYWSISLMAA